MSLAHTYTEAQIGEQPTIGSFARLGWITMSASAEILAAKLTDAGADTLLSSRTPDREVNGHDYAFNGPTPEEIKIVEDSGQ